MEKKNTLLLTVIAVATLLVAVVGATFAYFGSFTANVNQNTQVSTTTEAAKASTFTSLPGVVTMNVEASKMVKGSDDDIESKLAATSTGDNQNIKVSLNSAATDTFTICTFDVKFKDSSAVPYAKTTAVTGNEFTYQFGEGAKALENNEGATAVGSIKTGNMVTTETAYETLTTTDDKTIITGLQISAKGGTTTLTIPVTLRFYNVPGVDQSLVSDKTYAGMFHVTEPVCTTSTTDTVAA